MLCYPYELKLSKISQIADQDNQKKTPDNQHQSNNQQQPPQQHLQSQNQSSGIGLSYAGTGLGGSGNLVLTELPEPPIPVSEIGPIPPPPMFSTPSPTLLAGRVHTREMNNDYNYDGNSLVNCIRQLNTELSFGIDHEDQEEFDSDEEYPYIPQPNPNIDTTRIDEIPAKEPKFNAVPLKSALKKKSNTSNPGTPTQDTNRALIERQPNTTFK